MLGFEPHFFSDPKVLGREIIEMNESRPVDEHVAIAILPNGDFEDLRLDEKYDLRGLGAEKIIVVRSDRSFRLKIDDRDLEWPRACVSGFKLKKIAALPSGYTLWLQVRGGHDLEVADDDLINLDQPRVERFFSLQAQPICIYVNSREKFVDPGSLSFMDLVKLAFPDATPGPNTAYTVSFYKGPGSDPEGTLVKGETTKLKKGMVFNVSETDKS
ncbi:MAG: multiubiquitin domain-containing protein [Aestuariivita sp.]|nr:multiubiquitin domain-containing protein [Aestuariivita sp.]